MAQPKPGANQARFVEGSTMRHVVNMTATSSIGLVAIFLVDVLNIVYIGMLGKPQLTAAMGYATTLSWFFISLGIGMSVATSALTSRAIGSGESALAVRRASSSLVIAGASVALICALCYPFLPWILAAVGAKGETLQLAIRLTRILLPSVVILAIGMCLSSILRAAGDAKRPMWITLAPALFLAMFDPIVIFGFGWELDGIALLTIMARVLMFFIGWPAVIKLYKLWVRPKWSEIEAALRPFYGIAGPAALTQIASPIANAVVIWVIADLGDDVVSAWAAIGRLVPFAFGAIFALSGAVGPIMGQNLGAKRVDRVRASFHDAVKFTVVYCIVTSLVLAIFAGPIAKGFGATGQGETLVVFFCTWCACSFIFQGTMFIANAAFNVLGFPVYSTLLNWGRATIGVLPFTLLGKAYWGAKGVLVGYSLGSIVFGMIAWWLGLRVLKKIEQAT